MVLTLEMKKRWLDSTGCDLSQEMLEMLQVLMASVLTTKKLDRKDLSEERLTILTGWLFHGDVIANSGLLSVTKDFYDAMSEVLWLACIQNDS